MSLFPFASPMFPFIPALVIDASNCRALSSSESSNIVAKTNWCFLPVKFGSDFCRKSSEWGIRTGREVIIHTQNQMFYLLISFCTNNTPTHLSTLKSNGVNEAGTAPAWHHRPSQGEVQEPQRDYWIGTDPGAQAVKGSLGQNFNLKRLKIKNSCKITTTHRPKKRHKGTTRWSLESFYSHMFPASSMQYLLHRAVRFNIQCSVCIWQPWASSSQVAAPLLLAIKNLTPSTSPVFSCINISLHMNFECF